MYTIIAHSVYGRNYTDLPTHAQVVVGFTNPGHAKHAHCVQVFCQSFSVVSSSKGGERWWPNGAEKEIGLWPELSLEGVVCEDMIEIGKFLDKTYPVDKEVSSVSFKV